MKTRLAVLAAFLVLTTACTGSVPVGRPPVVVAGALQTFSDCRAFLSYVKRHALELVTPWGLTGLSAGPWMALEEAAAAEPSAAGDLRAGVDYSTTNVQVAGVDEPDLVKTDGRRILALARGRLFYVDLEDGEPVLRGSVRLEDRGWAQEMLVAGDRVLVLANGDGGVIPFHGDIAHPGYREVATLTEVDVSDPERPRIVRTLTVDGRYLSARSTGTTARAVLTSPPVGLEFVHPSASGLRAEREALEANRRVIENSTIDNWVPYHVLEDDDGRVVAEGPLLDCARAHHPEEFSGLAMLSVLTLDLERGLDSGLAEGSVGVLSQGETVYASPDFLYVATQRWVDPAQARPTEAPEGHRTLIHRFALPEGAPARYRASGEVTGWLLNQWAMDEHEGHLRVASTDAPPWWDTEESESFVTVLGERDGALVEVGRVGDLGLGERIFAVRFMGDLGYVVTFRQTDPLYVVDLRDPTAPEVSGELKILGYSAYLHPVGEGLLLGVGQDADDRGRVRGTQLSLFDVSDPADPRRIDQLTLADAHSEAEWDHRAFLWWDPTGLAVVPMAVWSWDRETEQEKGFVGALGIRVEDGALAEAGRISHGNRDLDWGAGIRRALVVEDRLYTVSELGVEAADLDTLDEVAWVPFR